MKNYDEIIRKYFTIKLYWEGDDPKLPIRLKKEYNIIINKMMQANGMPYSGSHPKYYAQRFDEITANTVWEARKPLCSKNRLIEYYIRNNEVNLLEIDKLNEYIKISTKKMSESVNAFYANMTDEEIKLLYKDRTDKHSKRIGLINAAHWKDPIWRDNQIQHRKDTGVYERSSETHKKWMAVPENKNYIKEVANKPERIKKISQGAIEMWKRLRMEDGEKLRNMVCNGTKKNFLVNDIHMNSIEFIIANLLNSLNIKWEYEKGFVFAEKMYIPDFYLCDYNIIIECYGDYWHASPRIFSENANIFKKLSAKNIRIRDDIRKDTFVNNGYNFIFFWEYDINNNLNTINDIICQTILKKK